ncbi:MAG: hypothetical protein HYU67_09580 [Flavobacteriia bacterium]|nr:hypothetical protein [Flavobacteriia bacterium]
MSLFLNSFYTITSHDFKENTHHFILTIDSKHKIFSGHFPNKPVTPGVVQMEILKELVEKAINCEVQLKSMPSCKFLAVLNPNIDNSIQVEIEIKEQNTEIIRLNALIKNQETNFTKLSLIYNLIK